MDGRQGRPVGVPASVGAAVARVRTAAGSVVGAGFLVDAQHLVTCAHVVDSALGRTGGSPPRDDEMVHVDFPLAAAGTVLCARVTVWLPPTPDDTGDVAVLALLDPLPTPIVPVRLTAADDLWGHPFRTFGFPRNRDHGVWATGLLRARQGAGWIQIEGTSSGYPIEPGFSGGAVWDDALTGVIGMTVAADSRGDVRAAYLIPADTLMRAWPALAESTLPPSPYRGLYPFRERDAGMFCGREDLTARLLRETERSPLVAVVGPSGSGKSSVVFAGLVPRLLQTEDWLSISMRPSQASSPLFALAAALLPVLEPEQSETQRLGAMEPLVQLLRDGRLLEVVDRVLTRAHRARLLLVVDQLEEIFARSPEDAQQFGRVLLSALRSQAESPACPLTIVLTLRADFLGQALHFPAMASALEGSVTTIGQMSREQLRDVIEKPLPGNVRYESGLVERILSDIGEEPGSLPLLEFALTLLWERQQNGVLTHRAYEDLGEVDGALASYAERVYSDQLLPDEQDDVRRLMLQLVRPTGVGTPVRRVARRREMSDAQWELGQRLAATRLLVADRDAAGTESVELVHEALIGEWARLDQWVEADLAFRTWQEQLRSAMAGWEASHRDAGALLRGAPLAEAERWLSDRCEDLTDQERQFIAAGRTLRGRSVRRLHIAVATLALLVLLAGTLGVVAILLFHRATEQAAKAGSRSLATEARQLAATELDKALLLAAAAYRMAPTTEATRLLTRLASENQDATRLVPTGLDPVQGVAFSPKSNDLVLLWNDRQLDLWNIADAEPVAKLTDRTKISGAVFSPDGRTVAFESQDPPEVSLWFPDDGRVQDVSPVTLSAYRDVGFSPDGRTLGICTDQGAEMWSVDPVERRFTVPGTAPSTGEEEAFVLCGISFSGNDRLSFLQDDDLVTWDIAAQRELGRDKVAEGDPATGQGADPTSFGITPTGSLAFFCRTGPFLTWWDVDRRTEVPGTDVPCTLGSFLTLTADGRHALNPSSGTNSVAMIDLDTRQLMGAYRQWPSSSSGAASRDGAMIATVAGGNLLRLTSTRDPSGIPQSVGQVAAGAARITAASDGLGVLSYDVGHELEGTVLAPLPPSENADPVPEDLGDDGRFFATTLRDRAEVDVTDLTSGTHRVLRPVSGNGPVVALALDPRGRFLAAADSAEVDVWDLVHGGGPTSIPLAGEVTALAVHPDGRRVAVVTVSGEVRMQDTADGNSADRPLPFTGATSVQFSRDGARLAIGTRSATYVWDTSTRPAQTRLIAPGESHGLTPAFSPDGRYLAVSGDEDGIGQVAVWQLSNRHQVGVVRIPGDDGSGSLPREVTFTRDGSELVVAASDGVFVGRFQPSWAMAQVCRIVGRNLSDREWERYAPDLPHAPPCR